MIYCFSEEQHAFSSISMVTKREKKDNYESYNGRSPLLGSSSQQEVESSTAEYSPGRINTSNNNNNHERLSPSASASPSGAIDMSRTSPSNKYREEEPPHQAISDEELEQNSAIGGDLSQQQRNGIISARGSFTMLHDRSSE